MSALEQIESLLAKPLKRPTSKPPEKVPQDILEKVERGRKAMRKDAAKRRVCQKFWEGDQYWYVNSKGGLSYMDTALVSAERPRHRIRNTYNFAISIVEGKVSASTQRIPGYEVTPSTNDPEDISQARFSGQVATYGYDKWRLRRHSTKLVTTALVQREGFVMPYFDPNVGPFTQNQETGEWEGLGEVKNLDLTRSEVGWEPEVDFDDSRWHMIERAMLKEEIKKIPGFVGGELEADANTSDVPKKPEDSVLVTQFLERPCPDYPMGRRCWIANKKIIVDYRRDPSCEEDWSDWWEPYPYVDANGEVADEPVIHRLSYTVNSEGDDLGLMERIIDLQRTINDCWNKILELKNRALMLQMIAPRGSNMVPRTDEPGAINLYDPASGMQPQWEQPPSPQFLQSLLQIKDAAVADLRALAADIDVQPDPDLAAKTANAAIESSRARWQSFLGDLAEVHSRWMRHCLTLVARHYTRPRQIEINGGYDWASVADFTGGDLRSQVNVRVLPGSIESRTRQQTMEEIQFLQTNWPGAIGPEQAIAVLHSGNPDALLKSPQYDIARAARMVRILQQGMPALDAQFQPVLRPMQVEVPGPVDPVTGQMGMPTTQTVMQEVPGWMPRKQDNVAIYKQVVGDFMKTPAYEQLPPDVQEGFNLFWSGLEFSEQEIAMEQAAMQQKMASDLGMANAAAPQGQIAQPSKPALNPSGGESPA